MHSKRYIDDPIIRRELIDFLSGFILERRVSQIQNVLKERTRYVTVVLEDIYQSQNASAVLRSCECLGIQDIHYIEGVHSFHINPQVVIGSSKWLTIRNYKGTDNNSIKAIESLKSNGYRIVATSPHVNEGSINDFDLDKGKVAVFFGTEKSGLSQTVMKNADEFISIPMFGFTESYNISVSAAIVMYTLIKKLRDSGVDYKLQQEESEILLLSWLKATSKNWEMMEKRFFQEKNIACSEKY
ncbi:MAG: TrmH family RNA methyltransferase [Bacteroidales bacterium]|nr:MAG: TrmH family RNA methyltransferase [Bacteroidales bacterium]